MKKLCLVYATKRGSTRKMAETMAESVSGVANVSVIDMESMPDITDCDLVVIGVPIYYEKPLSILKEFLKANDGLKDKKVALFVMCMASKFGSLGLRYSEKRYVRLSREGIKGDMVAVRVFNGWLRKEDSATIEEGKKWINDVVNSLM